MRKVKFIFAYLLLTTTVKGQTCEDSTKVYLNNAVNSKKVRFWSNCKIEVNPSLVFWTQSEKDSIKAGTIRTVKDKVTGYVTYENFPKPIQIPMNKLDSARCDKIFGIGNY